MKLKGNKGFTLIELLVVISIISLLSSIVLVSLNSARSKAQDARRKVDLRQVQTALELYYDKCGTYVVRPNCTGSAAYGAGGWGWFNYSLYAGSSGAVSRGLVDNAVIGGEIIDPTGATTGPTAYMIGADQNYYTIWSTIINPSSSDIATLSFCHFSDYDNYSGAGTQNYCVSN